MQNSASLTLVGCLLEEEGIDYSGSHLNDQTCTGHIDQQTHMVTFSFNSSNTCGAEVVVGTLIASCFFLGHDWKCQR